MNAASLASGVIVPAVTRVLACARTPSRLARVDRTILPGARAPGIANDPLPSWNAGASKQAILDFVAAVTDDGGNQFVSERDRIAVFDNDGTLLVEQPIYAQALFTRDQIRKLAPEHPAWATEQPYATVLADDAADMTQFAEVELVTLTAATHAGMTVDAFEAQAHAWSHSAINPLTGHLFMESVYQPQLELLDYLRANGFRTYVVTGAGIDLVRTFAEESFGIPPSQVIGSSARLAYTLADGVPIMTKQPELNSFNNQDNKPLNIRLHIGQKPILACGNSDGDQAMLEYVTSGDGPSLGLILHHDDAVREVAYDRASRIGKLDLAWDKATQEGWTIISMKDDWAKIFPFDNRH
jgi:phosphoglycolate phosphatase-like HAD superfamily hydrolase